MGFFSKLLGLGAAAGAAAGAYFVAKKYKDNAQEKQQMIDIPGADVETQYTVKAQESGFIDDVKKAASDVYDEAKETVKINAEKVGIDTEEFAGAMSEAGKAIAHASKAVAGTVKTAAPDVVESVKATADTAIKKVKKKINASESVEVTQNEELITIVEPVQEVEIKTQDETLPKE